MSAKLLSGYSANLPSHSLELHPFFQEGSMYIKNGKSYVHCRGGAGRNCNVIYTCLSSIHGRYIACLILNNQKEKLLMSDSRD